MTPAKLAEELEGLAKEVKRCADFIAETPRGYSINVAAAAESASAEYALAKWCAANAPAIIEALKGADEVAKLKEALAEAEERNGELWEEAYQEGATDTAGWEKDTTHAVPQWLVQEGDAFDIDHPDRNTTDSVIQALYDAKRRGKRRVETRPQAFLRGLMGG